MALSGFVPSAVRFRERNPNWLAHELRRTMGTSQTVRVDSYRGTAFTAGVRQITTDESLDAKALGDQQSTLIVYFDDGQVLRLDEIRAVDVQDRR